MSRSRRYNQAVTEPQRRFDIAVHDLMHSVGCLIQSGRTTLDQRDRGGEEPFTAAELAEIYLRRCPQVDQDLAAARQAYVDLVDAEMPLLAEPQERSA